jgi:hypothetical protein
MRKCHYCEEKCETMYYDAGCHGMVEVDVYYCVDCMVVVE